MFTLEQIKVMPYVHIQGCSRFWDFGHRHTSISNSFSVRLRKLQSSATVTKCDDKLNFYRLRECLRDYRENLIVYKIPVNSSKTRPKGNIRSTLGPVTTVKKCWKCRIGSLPAPESLLSRKLTMELHWQPRALGYTLVAVTGKPCSNCYGYHPSFHQLLLHLWNPFVYDPSEVCLPESRQMSQLAHMALRTSELSTFEVHVVTTN